MFDGKNYVGIILPRTTIDPQSTKTIITAATTTTKTEHTYETAVNERNMNVVIR